MRKFFLILIYLLFIVGSCCGCNEQSHRTKITFSSWGSKTETAIIKSLLTKFERENPDIDVEFIHTPANYFQKLHLLFASNLPPDVLFLNNYYFPQYQHYDLLEDLTPYFKEEINEGIFFSQALAAFERDGAVYAIPRDVSNVVIYFNKNLFNKYKLPHPSFDWKYSDMMSLAKSFKSLSQSPKIYGISFSEKSVFWLPFLSTNVEQKTNLYPYLTQRESVKILQEYADLANIYGVAPLKKELSGQTQAQIFMNGKMAMYVGGRWNLPKFLEIKNFEWNVVPFPYDGQLSLMVPLDASGWAISKKSKNKIEALKLLKFLTSAESIDKFSQSGLIVPARRDIAQSKNFIFANPFLEALKRSKPLKFDKESKKILENFELQLEPAFSGGRSVHECILEK